MISPRDRLIVALDVPDARSARKIIASLGERVHAYKVGLQLFTAEGPSLVRELKASGQRVFLDLKLHDIPNTVAGAVHSAAALGVDMLTIHASGGLQMMRAAVEASRDVPKPPLILAVTVLTSLSGSEMCQTGITGTVSEQVLRLASLAKAAGCGGIVASPQEVMDSRRLLGDELVIVTPGVRPRGSALGDQARTAEPAEAIKAGASYLVVGRPITEAADRKSAAEKVVLEISSTMSDQSQRSVSAL
jgi:orotidine-5'-phosphate decarboxylase